MLWYCDERDGKREKKWKEQSVDSDAAEYAACTTLEWSKTQRSNLIMSISVAHNVEEKGKAEGWTCICRRPDTNAGGRKKILL